VNYKEYYDKVFGGWIGRVAGSHLGAPLEFRPYPYIQRKYCNHWKADISAFVRPVNPYAVNDDELYQIASLVALEKYGIEVTAREIADEWQALLDPKQYLVELVALKNIRAGISPPDCALEKHGNFYYDSITGQMKGDIWGLLAPNCPDIAAHYATMDGSIASWGTGIDGQVFIAVLIANAFGISDIGELIQSSIQRIPEESGYRRFIEKCILIYEQHASWREARSALMQEWQEVRKELIGQTRSFWRHFFLRILHPLHVLPNAGIIVLSLLYGQDHADPFGRPLCIGAMMGYDTDCNCGNIGTIMGTILGEKQIPAQWKDPLRNQFHTFVKGHKHWRISDLSAKICEIGMKIIEANCPDHKIGEI